VAVRVPDIKARCRRKPGRAFLFLVRDLDLQEKLMHQNAEISAAIAATLNLRRPEYRTCRRLGDPL
jgi:hypothetical protein